MNQTKPYSIVGFIQGLANFYSEIKLANKESGQYKISSVAKGTLNEAPKITAQIRNKNIFHTLDVLAVVSNDNILHQFSRRDIKTLVYLACEYKNRPKVKIEKLSFCGKLKKVIFHFAKGSRSDLSQSNTASALISSSQIISHMSPHDAAKIGYTAGNEAFQEQQAQLDQLTNGRNNK